MTVIVLAIILAVTNPIVTRLSFRNLVFSPRDRSRRDLRQ